MHQTTLFDQPKGRREKRLSNQCSLILARLQGGRATGAELAAITHRFGARILELRKAGHNIVLAEHDRATGKTVYELQ